MTAYTSTQSGDWSNTATWGGSGPPGDGDTATIELTHTVEIDGDTVVGTSPGDKTTYVLVIKDTAQLKWKDSPSDNWTFTVKGNVDIQHGGKFSVGTSSNRIPSDKTATVYFPTTVTTGWKINCDGLLESYGAEAYHMEDASSQRTFLAQTVTGGVSSDITTAHPVNWLAGDTVWLGTGANLLSISTPEKVLIDSKTSAYEYGTSLLVYNHTKNDFLVNAERNVIFKGEDSTHGVTIYTNAISSANYDESKVNLDWTKLQYFGTGDAATDAAIYYKINVGDTPLEAVPEGNLSITNTVLDDFGHSNAYTIYVSSDLSFAGTSNILDNVHIWNGKKCLYLESDGVFRVKDLTCIGVDSWSVLAYQGDVRVDGLWFSPITYGANTNPAVKGSVSELKNFIIYQAQTGVLFEDGSAVRYARTKEVLLENGWMSRLSSMGVFTNGDQVHRGVARNVAINGCANMGFNFTKGGEWYLENCRVDRCLVGGITMSTGLTTGHPYNLTCRNCQFGKDSRNTGHNVVLYGTSIGRISEGRMIMKDCTFVKPISWAAYNGYSYLTEAMGWGCYQYTMADWSYRMTMAHGRTLEYDNCKIYEDSELTTEVFSTTYPDVTHLVVGGGGGEVRNEPTEILDIFVPPEGIEGNLAMKILPFSTKAPFIANYAHPIRIPLNSGEALSIKVYFKKDVDNPMFRPGLYLYGPGFYDEYILSSGVGGWEEASVGGTAASMGEAILYISGGANVSSPSSSDHQDSVWGPPSVGSGMESEDAFGVVVYADGLDIEIT